MIDLEIRPGIKTVQMQYDPCYFNICTFKCKIKCKGGSLKHEHLKYKNLIKKMFDHVLMLATYITVHGLCTQKFAAQSEQTG